MEKRVFLAIFLSFAVLAGYQLLFPPPPVTPLAQPPASSAAGTTAAPVTTPAPAGTAPAATAVEGGGTQPAQPAAPAAIVADAEARDVVVDTDWITARFSSAGGTLRSWKLKRYLENGQPLELVPQAIPDKHTPPFTLATDDASLTRVLASALYKPSADGLTLGSAPGTLTFQFQNAAGLTARKTFYFQPEGHVYVVKVEAAIDVNGKSLPVRISSGPMIGPGHSSDGASAQPPRAVQFRDNRVDRLAASSLITQSKYEGPMKFAGVEDHYFLHAALANNENIHVEYEPITEPVPNDPQGATRSFVAYTIAMPGAASMQYFIGPKDFDVLRNVGPQLDLVYAIDFGMFRVIVVPLLQALKSINKYVGNYGWSIVILTILINLAIFPLRHRSMVSMRKMQAIQPEMKAIQDRYKNLKVTDPERQKMNTEMMALYKQRGVNPASGCLPMLLTLPILFALYAMLSVAIELRGAPFFGWIKDLSHFDPWYVTPVLMGGTMFLQQRMMPSNADPVQQKVFMLLPLIFTFSFLRAPSGLVIYWLVSNLLAIGQQMVTNRIIGAPAVPAAAMRGKTAAAAAASTRKGTKPGNGSTNKS